MTNRTQTQVFRLLLIIAMAIQPIAIAHAHTMVTMNCSQDEAMAVGMQVQAGHQLSKQASLVSQHDSHLGEHAMKDCCHTSTSCSAAIVDTVTMAYMFVHADSTHSSPFWKSVIIPSESKPPRHLHA
jgi:hypothetical protein